MDLPVPSMDLSLILLLIGIGGALGGAAGFFGRFSLRDGAIVIERADASSDTGGAGAVAGYDRVGFGAAVLLTLVSVVIGCAGALAIQFVLVVLDAAKLEASAKHELFVLSISVAAGFGARRLLASLTARLEEQVRRAQITAAEAKQTAETTRRSVAEEAQFTAMVDTALRGHAGPATVAHVVQTLRQRLAQDPTDRNYAAPLGRLLKLQGQIDEALAVTDRFLAAKAARGERDLHFGATLYNKACYLAIRYGTNWREADRTDALQALREALALNDSNWDYAAIDEDLLSLRGAPEFAAIMEGAPARVRGLAGQATSAAPTAPAGSRPVS